MANVVFKRGLQSTLDELTSFVEGSFYLTTDTNRLYFAQSDSELVLLNQCIRKSAEMPEYSDDIKVGDIFYVYETNTIVVVSGKDDENETLTFDTVSGDSALVPNDESITVEATEDGVAIKSEFSDGKDNTISGSFELVGGEGTTVEVNDDGKVVITAVAQEVDVPEYSLNVEAGEDENAVITLNAKIGENEAEVVDSINLVGGTNIALEVEDNTITFKNNLTVDGGFNTGASASFDENGKLTISVADGADTVSASVTPTIKYGHKVVADESEGAEEGATKVETTEVFTFGEDGNGALDVYTADEVDAKIEEALSAAEAMSYKGVINPENAEDKLKDAIAGDVFKVAEAISEPVSAKVGDLLIAEQGSDGEMIFAVIPSGDDQVLTGTSANGVASISDQTGVLAGVKVVDGDLTTVSYSTENNIVSFAVNHVALEGGEVEFLSDTSTDDTFDVVISAGVDTYGHVNSITTRSITIADTHNDVDTVSATASVSDNTATINVAVATTDGTSENGSVDLTSSTLSFAKDAEKNSVSIDLTWGSF